MSVFVAGVHQQPDAEIAGDGESGTEWRRELLFGGQPKTLFRPFYFQQGFGSEFGTAGATTACIVSARR